MSLFKSQQEKNASIIVLLDSNILLNAIKEHWHINSMIETKIFQQYKIFVPQLITNELKTLQIKLTVKRGALNLANTSFNSISDRDYLNEEVYSKPVDDQLLQLAITLEKSDYRVVIMTQDRKLKEKIIDHNLPVILVSYGKAKLIQPSK